MISDMEKLFGATSRLSPFVQKLGYSGSPLPLDEWLKLQAIIDSSPEVSGKKRMQLPAAIVSCAQCGETLKRTAFELRKHFKRGHDPFYCSNECWGRAENIRRHGERRCVRCNGPAPRRNSFGTAKLGRIFCSLACKEEELREELEQRVLARMKPCERCNSMFVPANSSIRFCGRECASRHHAGAMQKKNNPRWKDGAFARRTTPHSTSRFRELRPLVLKRDGQKCVLCAATQSPAPRKSLEVHHIDEEPTNNRVANLVTLCRPCHEKAHFSPEKKTLRIQLQMHADLPLSTTSKWKKPNAFL